MKVQEFETLKQAHAAQAETLGPYHEALACADRAQKDLSGMLQDRERDNQQLEMQLGMVRDEARMQEGAASAAQQDANTMAEVNSRLGNLSSTLTTTVTSALTQRTGIYVPY